MMSFIDQLFPSSAPQLRTARVGDAPALAQLHASAFSRGWETEEFERLMSESAARGHVVTCGARGAVTGFVLSHVVVPEAEILSIAVATSMRRRGLGRMLLTHHLSRLAAEGVTTSFLEVEEGNQAALGLYAALGYDVIGRRRAYYGGTDALVLRRDF